MGGEKSVNQPVIAVFENIAHAVSFVITLIGPHKLQICKAVLARHDLPSLPPEPMPHSAFRATSSKCYYTCKLQPAACSFEGNVPRCSLDPLIGFSLAYLCNLPGSNYAAPCGTVICSSMINLSRKFAAPVCDYRFLGYVFYLS
jgi:hypothetical protein